MTKIQKIQQTTQQNQTICIDGLKFSLKGIIPQQKKGYRKIKKDINFHYRGYGTSLFNTFIDVLYKGERIGELEAHPKHAHTHPETVIFKVDNRLPYGKDWTTKVRKALKGCGLSWNHVLQIDIAVDVPDQGQFSFVHKLMSGKWKQLGNTTWALNTTFKGQEDNGNAKVRDIRFGNRKSDKWMRMYYKKQELNISNKLYIKEFWKANGFNVESDQEVCRFEFVLKRKELKKYVDVFDKYGELNLDRLQLLENTEYLASLFETAQYKFFEFITMKSYTKHKGDASRCRKKRPVSIQGIETYLLMKVTSKPTNLIWVTKQSAKHLYMIYRKTGEELIFKQVEDLIRNFDLEAWFYKRIGRFNNEFEARYSGNNFEYFKSYTSSPDFVQTKIFDLTSHIIKPIEPFKRIDI